MIHVGDCIPWLETFSDGAFDVMIADPPYSDHVHEKGLRSTRTKRNSRAQPEKRDLGFVPLTPALRRDFAIEAARTTRRWILIFSNEENVPAWRWDLRGAGLEVVRTCVWVKLGGAPQMTGDRPAAGYEPIIAAHRMHEDGRPMQKRWNGGGRNNVFTHAIPRGKHRIHTTEKPLDLLLELVELFSDPGELVADPFAGVATTGAACVRLGRTFIGAELDPLVATLADRRLLAEREGQTLSAHEAGQRTIWQEMSNGRAPNGDVGIMKS